MASIINSISFKNFFNYYGEFEDNRYDLEEGVNIIVADNGGGKSKFFNAFLWLFNGQILDSDDKIRKNIKDIYVKIVSDKAKNEIAIRGTVDCAIQIEYTFGKRHKYQIVKSFTLTKINGNISDPSSWQFTMNDTEVNRTELILTKYKPIYDEDEKKKIIDRLIMPAFRKYSFFQGEEVDEIIDFGEKESIEEAVKNLTDISKYNELVELTEDFKVKAEKDLSNQNTANNKQAKDLTAAIEEKERAQEQLNHELKKLKEWETTFTDAEKEKNHLDKTYANAEKRKEIDDKIKPLNKKLKDKVAEFEEFLDRINNKFFDGHFSWIAMGFDQVVKDFRSLNDKFIDERYKKKALMDIEESPNNYFHFLPVNSPDSVSLQSMIDNEYCYVCDRPAKEGSHEYDYLVKLKNRPTNNTEKDKSFVVNDLKDFFGNIQINAQTFYSRIPNVRNSVKLTREKEQDINRQIDQIKAKLKSLRDQRKDIFVGGEDSEISDAQILSNYQGAIRRMQDATNKIDDILRPKIKRLKDQIKNIENEIDSLSKTQDIPKGFKDNYEISVDLARATLNAKDRVYNNMVQLLEEHANNHFKNLTVNNDLAGGILRFEKTPSDSINFVYSDSNGNIVYGSSEGFQRMKKFSVVMAIISANSNDYKYPLLADAPISAFGEGFTEGFFEASGKVFPQSIVLVKEIYKRNDDMKINDLGRRLLKDKNVKTMYVNHVPEGAEQIELVTTKTKLK
jgi:DNA sulfur modification protein DndD